MILSAYDDYIPINNAMAIQHFLMVITLRMTHGLYRIHTSDWTRKRQNNGVGIYEYMLTCVAFGVNHTVDLHVLFSHCGVLDDVEMTKCSDRLTYILNQTRRVLRRRFDNGASSLNMALCPPLNAPITSQSHMNRFGRGRMVCKIFLYHTYI